MKQKEKGVSLKVNLGANWDTFLFEKVPGWFKKKPADKPVEFNINDAKETDDDRQRDGE